MVREAATVAVLVVLAINVPLVLLENHATASASRRNSLQNCATLLGVEGIMGEFIRSDAIDRKGQQTTSEKASVLKAFAKIIEPKLLQRLSAEQAALDKFTIDYWQGPAHRAGPFKNRTPLLQRVRDLEGRDCQRAVK